MFWGCWRWKLLDFQGWQTILGRNYDRIMSSALDKQQSIIRQRYKINTPEGYKTRESLQMRLAIP